MPIPDWTESDDPRMDTRMFEFVERRREEQARARRQRIQLVAIVALGLIAIALAVSNAVLVSRLVARPVTPPVVAPAPVRSAAPAPAAPGATTSSRLTAAAPSREPLPRPADAGPLTREPDEPATREAAAPLDEPPSLPERVTRTPSRPVPIAGERPPAARESFSAAIETDPALRTARWMIRSYGPLDAEGKALAAAQFYTGEEGRFWRRVVAHVRAER